MVRIRLSRTGKKRQASYRVVVADSKSPRDGRVVERIGFYNPMPDPAEYRIDEERALHWLSVGAQPSDAVRRLLEKQGTYDRLTRLRAGESFENLVA
jgi:small subunit ribosomal protein S16